jgi:hypothetical protein
MSKVFTVTKTSSKTAESTPVRAQGFHEAARLVATRKGYKRATLRVTAPSVRLAYVYTVGPKGLRYTGVAADSL